MKRVPFIVGAAALGASLFSPRLAAAQDTSVLGGSPRHYESPQNFAFEMRFGAYKPNIDDEPGLTKPVYENIFGTTPKFAIGAELDWQVLRIPHVGTLGPGLGVGYVSLSEQAKLSVPRGDKTTADEETALEIFPLWAVAVLRADVFPRELKVPLVPYVKGGLGLAFWRASTDAGTSSVDGISGKGYTWGTNVAAGLALQLDWLDEYTARNFDSSMGVNHTYLFFEVYSLSLSDFGKSNAFRVGSTSWTLGLNFEF